AVRSASLCLRQSRPPEDGAADPLRLLHQHDAQRRGDEHVQAGKRDEVRAGRGGDRVVLRRELGNDDREFSVREEGDTRVQALAATEAANGPGEEAAAGLPAESPSPSPREEPPDTLA